MVEQPIAPSQRGQCLGEEGVGSSNVSRIVLVVLPLPMPILLIVSVFMQTILPDKVAYIPQSLLPHEISLTEKIPRNPGWWTLDNSVKPSVHQIV